MTEFKISLFYDCAKCKARNFFDPYSFWEYSGNFKCAGCGDLYYAEWENGQRVVEPEKARGTDFILPGYAETADLKPLSGEGKTSPPPFANVTFLGKPKNLTNRLAASWSPAPSSPRKTWTAVAGNASAPSGSTENPGSRRVTLEQRRNVQYGEDSLRRLPGFQIYL